MTNTQKTFVEAKLAEAEANRREQCGQFSTSPLAKGVDYGSSVAVLTQALAHLAEGIPNGQTVRVAAAIDAATGALNNLNVWFHWVQKREAEEKVARAVAKNVAEVQDAKP